MVNGECYGELLWTFLFEELQRLDINSYKTWYQQDGTIACTARETMDLLRNVFPGCLTSCLALLNGLGLQIFQLMIIFSRDSLKKVFQTMLHSIQELKQRIWHEIEINRNPDMLQLWRTIFLKVHKK
jgi:hypothetical protein